MAIPNIKKQDIENAIKFIDENGVPQQNESLTYDLITENGKKYPPKYVVALADHLANGTDISSVDYNSITANHILQKYNYTIEKQQKKYELTISAENIVSTDERFTMDDLTLGNNYKPLKAYFRGADGKKVERVLSKNERKISNQTLPHIACQIYEKQLAAMTDEERENFPICRYKSSSNMIRGIYSSVETFKQHKNSIEFLVHKYDNNTKQFVIYTWSIFSTLIFVQECLRRFGNTGDTFILNYYEKNPNDLTLPVPDIEYQTPFSPMLIESKNLIFRGAPGTGKSYLAKQIAADIISNGETDDYTKLTVEQKKQVEFVQFHPSYDYSDFVEGLRPKVNDDGTMGFELQDGIFKRFVARARKNYEDSQKSQKDIEKEVTVQEAMSNFFSEMELGVDKFRTVNGTEFTITSVDDKFINISIQKNASVNKLSIYVDELRKMLESDVKFTKVKDVTSFFGTIFSAQAYSYYFAIYNSIKDKYISNARINTEPVELKRFVFIIDEINRGEISKIFGELFFAIDPSYRGRAGEISTQYANLHADPDDKFFIPENVYIIGTMNDIDRSVDSFDFAMRRRFRFI